MSESRASHTRDAADQRPKASINIALPIPGVGGVALSVSPSPSPERPPRTVKAMLRSMGRDAIRLGADLVGLAADILSTLRAIVRGMGGK